MKVHPGVLLRDRMLGSVRQLASDVVSSWNRFWFDPADPLMLGIVRLLTGWMLFYNLLVWSLDLEAFFGNDGLQPLAAIQRVYGSRFVLSFWLWTGDSYLWPIHFTCLAIAAMFCLGLATRVTSILSFLITISYSQRVPVANFGFDQILGMLCLYLSIGPSGAAVSLDAVLRRLWQRRNGLTTAPQKFASARMAMRLIQLHLCAIYFWAGLSKLKGPTWWTGAAMWNVIANHEYQTLDLTWMAWAPWIPFLIAHLTIVWEVFFIALIWNRRLRPLVLMIGVAMHVGIGAFLGMWTFGLIMAFAYLAFSDPDVWRRRLQALSQWHGPSSPTPSNATCEVPLQASESLAMPSTAETPPEEFRLTNETQREGIEVPAVLQSCEYSPVCVISKSSDDRSKLRRYFREHDVECRAVGDLSSGLELLSHDRFRSILVNGACIPTTDLINFVADAADLSALPILVMLTPKQMESLSEFNRIHGAGWIRLPASLKEIRQRLQFLQDNRGESSATDVLPLKLETDL